MHQVKIVNVMLISGSTADLFPLGEEGAAAAVDSVLGKLGQTLPAPARGGAGEDTPATGEDGPAYSGADDPPTSEKDDTPP